MSKNIFESAFRQVRQVFGTCSETPWTLGFFLVRNILSIHGETVNRVFSKGLECQLKP